jgi:hypothetical protein
MASYYQDWTWTTSLATDVLDPTFTQQTESKYGITLNDQCYLGDSVNRVCQWDPVVEFRSTTAVVARN